MNKSTKILLATALLLVALAAVILYYSSTVFLQLFLAFALAYVLNPAVVFLERKGVGRIPCILIVFTAALLICAGIAVFFIVSLGSEFSSMQLNLPAYARHLYEIVPAAVKSYLRIETPDKLALRLDEVITQARSAAPDIVKPILNLLREAFSSTIAFILAFLGYFIIPV
jgi:predicted PurR-regulated permease PerM